MSKVGKIRREELMDWVERMLTKGNYSEDVKLIGVSVRHIDGLDDAHKGTFLVVSDEESKEIWFPLGPGEICDIKKKKYKEDQNNVKN